MSVHSHTSGPGGAGGSCRWEDSPRCVWRSTCRHSAMQPATGLHDQRCAEAGRRCRDRLGILRTFGRPFWPTGCRCGRISGASRGIRPVLFRGLRARWCAPPSSTPTRWRRSPQPPTNAGKVGRSFCPSRCWRVRTTARRVSHRPSPRKPARFGSTKIGRSAPAPAAFSFPPLGVVHVAGRTARAGWRSTCRPSAMCQTRRGVSKLRRKGHVET